MGVMTVLAICFAQWIDLRNKEQRLIEHFLLTEGRPPPPTIIRRTDYLSEANSIELIPRFPRCVRDLFGDDRLWALGVNRPLLYVVWRRSATEDLKYLIDRYPSSEYIVAEKMSGADWKAFERLSCVERLEHGWASNAEISHVETLRNLRELKFWGEELGPLSDPELFICLANLPGAPTAAGLATLSNMKNLKRLSVRRTKENRDALDAFIKAHPDLVIYVDDFTS
jgi:hypothetical protein